MADERNEKGYGTVNGYEGVYQDGHQDGGSDQVDQEGSGGARPSDDGLSAGEDSFGTGTYTGSSYGSGASPSSGAGTGYSAGASGASAYRNIGASGAAGYGGADYSTGASGSASAGYSAGASGAPAYRNTGASGAAGYSGTGYSAGASAYRNTGASGSAGYGGAGYSAGASGASAYGNTGASASTAYGAGAADNAAGRAQGAGDGHHGNGRYYSYSGSQGTAAGNGGRGPARPPKKKNGMIGIILAVILVFVAGAGAGAYFSGRSAAASLGGGSSSRSQGEGSAKTGKDDASDGNSESGSDKKAKKDSSDSAGSGDSISRVSDSEKRDDGGEASDLADDTVADVAERVMPAIVSVYNKYTQKGQFFGRTYTQEAESAGSGIIIEETEDELLIVTNNHVVEGADSLSVQFIDEENCEAALKGTDVSSDLAVISVKLDDISADTKKKIAIAELGDSDTLRIGERAIAIGNALGYGQSLTVGYVSALNREVTSENGITGTFIQTDAAINPGNSGGALLNSRGQVIGINSNKIGGSAVESMGFAIPISKAIPIIEELKLQQSRTKVADEDQGMLGIHGISVTSDVASAYGLPVGAYVEEIIEGGGASKSDLREGDVITGLDGQSVTSMEDLRRLLVYYEAGTEVTLTVQHPLEGSEYEEREIPVTLSRRSDLPDEDMSGEQEYPGGREQEQEEDDFFSFPFGF